MSVSIAAFPRSGLGNEWLGRLCLKYVNRLHERRSAPFAEMWAELPAAAPAGPDAKGLVIVALPYAGGISALLRLYNEAYVGAADYRRAGWVEARALQTARGYDPSLIFIGLREGRPVGFCMARKSGQRGRITGIAVRPEHRGRGFGAALLRHAMDQLAARGASRVHLSADTYCPACRRLYARAGFRMPGPNGAGETVSRLSGLTSKELN
jgi:ribosomal protein S18 acetylase RimI-like enzyme